MATDHSATAPQPITFCSGNYFHSSATLISAAGIFVIICATATVNISFSSVVNFSMCTGNLLVWVA